MTFSEALSTGRAGESLIARFVQSKGFLVMPVYEKLIDDNKGPQVYAVDSTYVAPDLFVFNQQKSFFIEAKHKTAFTWHRKTERWTTGIDRHHFNDYLKIKAESPFDVWLFFLQRGGHAKDSPLVSPSGLYGGEIGYLEENINHTHDNWGRHGMIYWSEQVLKKIATIEQVNEAAYTRADTGIPQFAY